MKNNDDKIVLEGVLQTFNPKNDNNGRIYPHDAYKKHFRDIKMKAKQDLRIKKLKRIIDEE